MNLKPHQVTIAWKPPVYAQICVTGYKIVGWNELNYPIVSFEVTTTNLTTTLENLNSCESYLTQITAATKDSFGQVLEFGMVTGAVIAIAPKLEMLSTSSRHIELKAEKNDPTDKCDVIFAKITCEATSNVPRKVSFHVSPPYIFNC